MQFESETLKYIFEQLDQMTKSLEIENEFLKSKILQQEKEIELLKKNFQALSLPEKEKFGRIKYCFTSIPQKQWGVHEHHCCSKHGCKYGNEDCPVELGLIKQKYPCESCEE